MPPSSKVAPSCHFLRNAVHDVVVSPMNSCRPRVGFSKWTSHGVDAISPAGDDRSSALQLAATRGEEPAPTTRAAMMIESSPFSLSASHTRSRTGGQAAIEDDDVAIATTAHRAFATALRQPSTHGRPAISPAAARASQQPRTVPSREPWPAAVMLFAMGKHNHAASTPARRECAI